MLVQRFYWWFSNHDMNAMFDAMLRYREMRVVGREDDGAVAFF